MKTLTTFVTVRVRVTASIVLAARVELQGDADMDRTNIASVRRQLRHFARTGEYVPSWSSEPGLDELGMRVRCERRGNTVPLSTARTVTRG
jgi:hypothetical protein